MIIHLDAKVGQTVEEFAHELHWIATRLNCTIIAKYKGTEFVATSGDLPAFLVQIYNKQVRDR